MVPKTWMYRHDEIVVPRPYGVDVDEDDWLWEGCGAGRVVGHNLRTNAMRIIPVPEMSGHVVYQAFAWQGRLLMVLGTGVPHYLVLDPQTGRCERRDIPAHKPIVWYGTKTPQGKVILYERSESLALVLDAPDAAPRVVPCPFGGHIAGGQACTDGLIYSSLTDPGRMVRFDPADERFVDENPAPFPEATMSGKTEHGGVLYCADSARGRLLPLRMATGEWLDPVPTPDHGEVYGYVGGAFTFGGKGYYCLSTYAHASRLDTETGKIVIPEGPLTVDGRAPRFMERYLVFDAAARTFDYLVAPQQPDGVPLLCYAWTDGARFAVTGIVIPFAAPGEPGPICGPWLVMQSQEAAEEPGFGRYDTRWDRSEHMLRYRRTYAATRALYLPEEPHCPATVNMMGPATQYSPGRSDELLRRARRTDADAYWKDLAETVLRDLETDAQKAKTITAFIHHALYYNPIQEPLLQDPIGVLESHDARCGQGAEITLALMAAAGIESRRAGLHHHVVAEAFYDDAWHIADALFFGGNPPNRDDRVLSVDELKADPYFADAWPQECFAYDPELLLSEDGFQVLGYVFGPWGSEPYYSFYLGGDYDLPPTLPTVLPPVRAGESRVKLRWAESAKMGGGRVEYDVRVFADRACREEVFQAATEQTSIEFDVPEANRMYFVQARAMDDHRAKNPDTWYPATRSNFVLVPPEQYGWYGVM